MKGDVLSGIFAEFCDEEDDDDDNENENGNGNYATDDLHNLETDENFVSYQTKTQEIDLGYPLEAQNFDLHLNTSHESSK